MTTLLHAQETVLVALLREAFPAFTVIGTLDDAGAQRTRGVPRPPAILVRWAGFDSSPAEHVRMARWIVTILVADLRGGDARRLHAETGMYAAVEAITRLLHGRSLADDAGPLQVVETIPRRGGNPWAETDIVMRQALPSVSRSFVAFGTGIDLLGFFEPELDLAGAPGEVFLVAAPGSPWQLAGSVADAEMLRESIDGNAAVALLQDPWIAPRCVVTDAHESLHLGTDRAESLDGAPHAVAIHPSRSVAMKHFGPMVDAQARGLFHWFQTHRLDPSLIHAESGMPTRTAWLVDDPVRELTNDLARVTVALRLGDTLLAPAESPE